MKKAVFLDRDGVVNKSILLNGKPTPPNTPQDVEILEGVVEAIETLKLHDYVPIVITNQPDVARGLITKDEVIAINAYIGRVTKIGHFYTCFHDDSDSCVCRKPQPGLIYQAAKDLAIDIKNSHLIGDRWRDIAAGQAAGCKTFFIDYSYDEKQPQLPYSTVLSLKDAVEIIIGVSNATY
jgi:D-glycero-D-manno-heptose 1,7-bisphosphate phosphatase